MHVLAIQAVPGPPDEAAAQLAGALGGSPSDLRAAVLGLPPRIVATRPDRASAQPLAAALWQLGYDPLLLGPDDVDGDAHRVVARTFTLDPQALHATARDGATHVLAWADLALLLRATHIDRSSTVATVTSRKLSLGRALVTGGLSSTKKVTRAQLRETEARDVVLELRRRGRPVVVIRESDTLFDGLGPLRQATRAANLLRLVDLLRARAPHALVDDRLLTRPGQVQLLGQALAPEHHLHLATSLLARHLLR